jgi:hypothetical protein
MYTGIMTHELAVQEQKQLALTLELMANLLVLKATLILTAAVHYGLQKQQEKLGRMAYQLFSLTIQHPLIVYAQLLAERIVPQKHLVQVQMLEQGVVNGINRFYRRTTKR